MYILKQVCVYSQLQKLLCASAFPLDRSSEHTLQSVGGRAVLVWLRNQMICTIEEYCTLLEILVRYHGLYKFQMQTCSLSMAQRLMLLLIS